MHISNTQAARFFQKIQETLIHDSLKTEARKGNLKWKENNVLIENEPMEEPTRQKSETSGRDMLRAFNANLKSAVAAKETIQNELRQKVPEIVVAKSKSSNVAHFT